MTKLQSLALGAVALVTLNSCGEFEQDLNAPKRGSRKQSQTNIQLYQEFNKELQRNGIEGALLPDQEGNPMYLEKQSKGVYKKRDSQGNEESIIVWKEMFDDNK